MIWIVVALVIGGVLGYCVRLYQNEIEAEAAKIEASVATTAKTLEADAAKKL